MLLTAFYDKICGESAIVFTNISDRKAKHAIPLEQDKNIEK